MIKPKSEKIQYPLHKKFQKNLKSIKKFATFSNYFGTQLTDRVNLLCDRQIDRQTDRPTDNGQRQTNRRLDM